MWNYIKNIFSFGYEGSNEVLSPEEEEEIINSLKNPDDIDTCLSKDYNNYEIEERIGVITGINGNNAVIDDIYYFIYDPKSNGLLFLNDKVKFTVYFNDIDTIIKNIEKLVEDSCVEHAEDTLIKIVGDSDSQDVSLISGQIFNRNKRIFDVKVDNKLEYIQFNLNNVKSEFIPHLGDFVDLDVILPSEETPQDTNNLNIKVVKVRPRKTALKVGNITSWDNKYGCISNFALFSLGVCEAGFNPAVGYKVCASLIRSDCVNGYKWRAIQVIPHDNINDVSLSGKQQVNFEEELRNKGGIFISIVPKLNMKLNEEGNFNIKVSNKSSLDKVFSFYPLIKSEMSQVEACYHSQNDISIKAGGVIDFPFKILSKFVGKSYEDLIFNFVDFKIRRRIIFEVMCETLLPDSEVSDISFQNHFSKNITSRDVISKTEGEIFPGRRKFGSYFIPVKIGEFRVPKILLEIVLPESISSHVDTRLQIEKYFPCLKEGLSPETYREYMHTLLFLEEVSLLRKLALLDIEDASFVKYLDYLILRVPEYSFYVKMLLPGDSVLVSLPWNKEKKMQGIIHKVTKAELWLKFSQQFHSEYKEGSTYFTTFITSRMSLRRNHEAIDVALKFLGTKWLFPSCVEPQPPQVVIERYDEGTSPFDLEDNEPQEECASPNDELLAKYMGRGRGKKSFRGKGTYWNCKGSGYGRGIRVKEYEPDIDTVVTKNVEWFNPSLNTQQKKAVLRILCGIARPQPYIIFGPPGTGKTVTVVESILQVHKLLPKSNILVGTPTNSAADLIGIRLMEYGNLQEGDFLRLVGHSYAEQGRLISSLVPYSAVPSFGQKGFSEPSDDCDLPQFNRSQIGQHRIIVATLSCIGNLYSMGFPRGYFTHTFIDEAGQAVEPEFLVPMTFLSPTTGHVILSGDPLQLGPVVTSTFARTYGFADSFLYRLLNRFPYVKDPQGFSKNYGYDPRLVTKLVNNYRSLEGILQVFNTLFYDGDLIPNISNHTSEEAKLILNLKSFKISCPVIFHGLRGNSLHERDSKSCYNPQEIFQVFCYLNKLYYDGVHPDQVGIITPYQLQARKIQDALESHQLEAPKIGSVEEFQGQEKMVIILSVVRSAETSGDHHTADFVTNPRRVNVAISRARALLIIIGDPELLDTYKIWHRILKYCIVNDSYVGCQPPQNLKS